MHRKHVDVLVIGSGMGGMSAAAMLSREGYQVLIAEKLPRVGGRCSTLEFNGYKCITGVIGIETNGIVQELFETIGADFDIRPAGAPHYLIRGSVCEVPPRGGMKHLLKAAGVGPVSVEKVMSAVSRALQWKEPSPGISLSDWIRQYSKHQGVADIFQTLVAATLMVHLADVPARYFFRFLKELNGVNHFGYAPQGSLALPTALGKVIQQAGGEIWTGSPVSQILVEKGVVQGAVVDNRGTPTQVDASVIISDTGPLETVMLAGKSNFDPDYLNELHTKRGTANVVCLQFSLDAPLIEQNHLLITGLKRINALYQPTLICPELAPAGKHLLIAGGAPLPQDCLEKEAGRKQVIDSCLDDLRLLFPDFDQRADVLLAGVNHDRWPGMHAWPGKDMPQKTTVINLYNVGDGVKQIGYTGLPSVVKSGMLVADEIKQRMGIINGNAKVS